MGCEQKSVGAMRDDPNLFFGGERKLIISYCSFTDPAFAVSHSQETHFVWFCLLFKGAPCPGGGGGYMTC